MRIKGEARSSAALRPLEHDLAGDQSLQLLLAHSRLTQDINRVFAERRDRTPIGRDRGRPLAGNTGLADPADDRMLHLREEARGGQVLVFKKRLQRVIGKIGISVSGRISRHSRVVRCSSTSETSW